MQIFQTKTAAKPTDGKSSKSRQTEEKNRE